MARAQEDRAHDPIRSRHVPGWARLTAPAATVPAPGTVPQAGGVPLAGTAARFAWALFEWARNPYVILITIYVYAPYFAVHVTGDPVRGQALVSLAHTISGAAVAILSPIMGAVADAAGRRKPWIAIFATLLAAGSLALWAAYPGAPDWLVYTIVAVTVINGISYSFTEVFHNSMLPALAPPERLGGLSGLGLALGNMGALVLLLGALWAFALPGLVTWDLVPEAPLLGLDRGDHGPDRIVGPLVGLWLLIFTLPLLILTPDRPASGMALGRSIQLGLAQLLGTIKTLGAYRNVARYLIARMIFADGKAGVLIFSGVYAAGTFGWNGLALILYGIFLSIFAFVGGLIGGWLDDRLGSKRALQWSLALASLGLILAISQSKDALFGVIPYDPVNGARVWRSLPFFQTLPEIAYLLCGILIAMAITAAYASARTLLARLAPPDKISQFFGLYALAGTATSFLAPALVGLATAWSGSQRIGFSMPLVLIGLGFALLWGVRPDRDGGEARQTASD